MKNLTGLDKTKFTEEFLEAYLKDGFAAMTKREIDLLVLRLLVDHKDGWSWENPPNAFEMAQVLKAKRTRLRSMMDELSFRMFADGDHARMRLRKIIEDRIRQEGDDIFEEGRVRIQIEDGFLREYAKDLIQKNYGIVDSSFNSSLIVLSGDKFLALVFEVISDTDRDRVTRELEQHWQSLQARDNQAIFTMFIEQAVRGAGREAGRQALKLGITALTGGGDRLPGLVKWFVDKMNQDDAEGNPQGEVMND